MNIVYSNNKYDNSMNKTQLKVELQCLFKCISIRMVI